MLPTLTVLETVDSNLYPTVCETISVQSQQTPMGGNGCINTVLTQILACVFTTVTSTTLPNKLLDTLP